MVAQAHHEGRSVKTVDIGGAYLYAPIGEKEVFMKVDKLFTTILSKIDPTLKPFIDEKGESVFRLNRALYGCVQSALQWHKEITGFLVSIGFSSNAMDPCVLNKLQSDGKQLTVLLHVDDLMILGSLPEIDSVADSLREKYGEVSEHDGPVVPYIGMLFDFSGDRVRISMDKYVDDLLLEYSVTGVANTPASDRLFEISETSDRLQKEDSDIFHSRVAKLLYLAKRVRPEILPAISFLTSRVL